MRWLPKYWNHITALHSLLLPVSFIFYMLVVIRRALYRSGILVVTRLPVPVIVVGNITVGGSGKTPLTLWLAQQLIDRGIAIVPIAQNSNYLSANFVAVESFTGKDLMLLEPVKKQLIWLKMGNSGLTDPDLEAVGKLPNLRMLFLQNTKITDQGLPQLSNLSELQYLNLGGTKVTSKGVGQLKGLKNLRQLFLFRTAITGDDLDKLRQLFSNTVIDAGGYEVPKLVSDTTVLKAPIGK